MMANPQGVGHHRQGRVHRTTGGEETRVHDREIIHTVRFTVRTASCVVYPQPLHALAGACRLERRGASTIVDKVSGPGLLGGQWGRFMVRDWDVCHPSAPAADAAPPPRRTKKSLGSTQSP